MFISVPGRTSCLLLLKHLSFYIITKASDFLICSVVKEWRHYQFISLCSSLFRMLLKIDLCTKNLERLDFTQILVTTTSLNP